MQIRWKRSFLWLWGFVGALLMAFLIAVISKMVDLWFEGEWEKVENNPIGGTLMNILSAIIEVKNDLFGVGFINFAFIVSFSMLFFGLLQFFWDNVLIYRFRPKHISREQKLLKQNEHLQDEYNHLKGKLLRAPQLTDEQTFLKLLFKNDTWAILGSNNIESVQLHSSPEDTNKIVYSSSENPNAFTKSFAMDLWNQDEFVSDKTHTTDYIIVVRFKKPISTRNLGNDLKSRLSESNKEVDKKIINNRRPHGKQTSEMSIIDVRAADLDIFTFNFNFTGNWEG